MAHAARTRPGAGGRVGTYALSVLVAVVVVLAFSALLRRQPSAIPSGGVRLWPAPAFSFVDHTGRLVSRESLAGAPFVASFFFTTCPTACPLLTTKLVALQQRTRTERIAFVSFSLDPHHDSTDVLHNFAQQWNADETRWHLLRTERRLLDDALAGFRVTTRQTSDASNLIIHSSAFFLVDAEGYVRGVYPSDDDSALSVLTRDVLVLARGQAPQEIK